VRGVRRGGAWFGVVGSLGESGMQGRRRVFRWLRTGSHGVECEGGQLRTGLDEAAW
jgi:hypothetical protein